MHEEVDPEKPYPQDLHDMGQQQDSNRSFSEGVSGVSDGGVSGVRGLKPCGLPGEMRGVGVLTVLRIALKACKSKDGPLT